MMKQPLKSKLIDGVSYDEESHRLLLFMVNGHRREYVDVPLYVYTDLLATKSPGTYYTRLIKPKFAAAHSG
ncbi:KTSC domain-containing protein [Rhizobium tumorigenes]|uniref:KTSC domain-containing protein n=1 Tax=Rhizobium tumorigenes TaxID=2041385 RepID=UPI00241C583A|nr:KTSC domain-containing protein [Rhizobium tumorigenes]WFS03328.1 KTSC domain-containing protein [Rhizobium tumorigenes]